MGIHLPVLVIMQADMDSVYGHQVPTKKVLKEIPGSIYLGALLPVCTTVHHRQGCKGLPFLLLIVPGTCLQPHFDNAQHMWPQRTVCLLPETTDPDFQLEVHVHTHCTPGTAFCKGSKGENWVLWPNNCWHFAKWPPLTVFPSSLQTSQGYWFNRTVTVLLHPATTAAAKHWYRYISQPAKYKDHPDPLPSNKAHALCIGVIWPRQWQSTSNFDPSSTVQVCRLTVCVFKSSAKGSTWLASAGCSTVPVPEVWPPPQTS